VAYSFCLHDPGWRSFAARLLQKDAAAKNLDATEVDRRGVTVAARISSLLDLPAALA
jgi:hypothetical protein